MGKQRDEGPCGQGQSSDKCMSLVDRHPATTCVQDGIVKHWRNVRWGALDPIYPVRG